METTQVYALESQIETLNGKIESLSNKILSNVEMGHTYMGISKAEYSYIQRSNRNMVKDLKAQVKSLKAELKALVRADKTFR